MPQSGQLCRLCRWYVLRMPCALLRAGMPPPSFSSLLFSAVWGRRAGAGTGHARIFLALFSIYILHTYYMYTLHARAGAGTGHARLFLTLLSNNILHTTYMLHVHTAYLFYLAVWGRRAGGRRGERGRSRYCVCHRFPFLFFLFLAVWGRRSGGRRGERGRGHGALRGAVQDRPRRGVPRD